MRELYFRAFEIAIKNSFATVKYVADESGTISSKVIRAATGLMTSMNYIGPVFAGANYELSTELLRDEWGFQGTVITDMCMNGGPQNPDGTWPSNSIDQCLRSGNDLFMTMMSQGGVNALDDHTSATAVTAIKQAVPQSALHDRKQQCHDRYSSRLHGILRYVALDGMADSCQRVRLRSMSVLGGYDCSAYHRF